MSDRSPFTVQGRVARVTVAGSGSGRAAASRLASAGAAWSACRITVDTLTAGCFPTALSGPVFPDAELAARNAAQTCVGGSGSEASAHVTGQTVFVDGASIAK